MKKIYIILITVIILVTTVRFTYALTDDNSNLFSVFKSNKYQTEIIEDNINSDNWLPGNTIDKNIYIENKGNSDIVVRASIIEEWVSRNGKKLSGFQNDNKAALINISDNNDWIKIGDYYYYKHKLSKSAKTSNLIDSVTFNVAIEAESGCIKEYGEGTIKTICTSSDSSYAGASYKLKVVVDTIEYDLYKKEWNIDLEI